MAKFTCLVVLLILYLIGCSPILQKGTIKSKNAARSFSLGMPGKFKKVGIYFRLFPTVDKIRSGVNVQFRLVFWRPELGGSSEGPYTDPELNPVIRMWMIMDSGMGHPPSNQGTISISRDDRGQEITGSYDLDDVNFNMNCENGYWQAKIKLENSEGNKIDEEVQTFQF